MASGIKSSLDVLLGKSEDVTVIDAYLDQQSFEDRLDEYFRSLPEDEQVVMLSDIYGGSVNQRAAPYQVQYFSDHRDELSFGAATLMETEPLSIERFKNYCGRKSGGTDVVEFQTTGTEEKIFWR